MSCRWAHFHSCVYYSFKCVECVSTVDNDRSRCSCFALIEPRARWTSTLNRLSLFTLKETERGWPAPRFPYFTAWQPNMRQLFPPQPPTISPHLSLLLSLDLWGKERNKNTVGFCVPLRLLLERLFRQM